MKKEAKPVDPNDKDAIIKAKDEEILGLKAENEYLRKLRAAVQARKGQQPKTKQRLYMNFSISIHQWPFLMFQDLKGQHITTP